MIYHVSNLEFFQVSKAFAARLSELHDVSYAILYALYLRVAHSWLLYLFTPIPILCVFARKPSMSFSAESESFKHFLQCVKTRCYSTLCHLLINLCIHLVVDSRVGEEQKIGPDNCIHLFIFFAMILV